MMLWFGYVNHVFTHRYSLSHSWDTKHIYVAHLHINKLLKNLDKVSIFLEIIAYISKNTLAHKLPVINGYF